MNIYDTYNLSEHERITAIWRSGLVQRFHSNPDMARYGQTNAQHQWGCAMLIMQLFPDASSAVLKVALTHDVAEMWVGDLSAPAKSQYPALRAALLECEYDILIKLDLRAPPLTEHEHAMLKFVDRLEAIIYVAHCDPSILLSYDWSDAIFAATNDGAALGLTRHLVRSLIWGTEGEAEASP